MPIFAVIGRLVLFPFGFIREVIEQLKQVTWPTRKQTMQSTAIVVLFSVFIGIVIGGLDFIYVKAFGLFFK
jgi:preprotein translocase subunit SecE